MEISRLRGMMKWNGCSGLPASAIVLPSRSAATLKTSGARHSQAVGSKEISIPCPRLSGEIEGLKAYPSIEALPGTPDLAMIITPAETVADIVAACGRKGIWRRIVYSAGFEEVDSGKEHARRLAQAAGPQCCRPGPELPGLVVARGSRRLQLQLRRPRARRAKASAHRRHQPERCACGRHRQLLQKSGIGCSYIVSVGNETCLDLVEILGWVIEQDNVRVVALYIEGLNDAGRLSRWPSARAGAACRSLR